MGYMKKTFNEIIEYSNLIFYGYSYSRLPNILSRFNNVSLAIFFKETGQKKRLDEEFKWYYYSNFRDINSTGKDVLFLDQDATKTLCIGMPSNV